MGLPTRLAGYEIEGMLGAGGMGEVYRARDTKLGRSVAVKVLPEAFAQNPDRIARFEREAKVLAALNHPNIATLHGMEQSDGQHFLVMELVEGETLAESLNRGPIPVEESLKVANKILEALEAAHEKGIVHRDLKPANVKVTPDGKVKVLDFGLAKAMENTPANTNLSNSPTLSMAATQAGVILGTAAYMSPEQAKGAEADARSDVFSFGCVFYEMLTGRQPFQGESVSEILAAVLIREADLSGLPPNLNPRIQEILRRCLEKSPKRRWQGVADLRAELEAIAAAPRVMPAVVSSVTQRAPLWKRALPMIASAVVFGALAVIAGWNLKPSPARMITRFPLVLPESQIFGRTPRGLIAISRDGSILAYTSGGLFLRRMSEMEARPLTGAGLDVSTPFFSPDGQWIGYFSFADSSLKKIAVTGGAPVTICKSCNAVQASWEGDQIVFATADNAAVGIQRVSASGGEPEVLIPIKPEEGIAQTPQIIDNGRAVLFTFAPPGSSVPERWDQAQIVVHSLSSGERKVVLRGGSAARYLSTGHILYALGGNLLAVPFDLKTLETKGGPVPVVEGVMRASQGQSAVAQFAISDNGSLAYIVGGAAGSNSRQTLALADRNGKVQTLPLAPAAYEDPRISPDGKQLAVNTNDGKEQIVWIYDFAGGSTPRRLTFGANFAVPVWSRDGRYLFFRGDREGKLGLFRQLADGTGPAERLTTAEQTDIRHVPFSVDPTGKTLAFEVRRTVAADSDIFLLPLEGDRKPRPLFEMPKFQAHAVFSPDGKWLAYMSNELNDVRPQIFVQPYPGTGAKYQITTEGGGEPLWSPDGKQMFYYFNNRLYAVDVRTDPTFSIGKPSPLPISGVIQSIGFPRNYDITPDGKQFLVVLPASQAETSQRSVPQINITLNWFEELKQRVPRAN